MTEQSSYVTYIPADHLLHIIMSKTTIVSQNYSLNLTAILFLHKTQEEIENKISCKIIFLKID